jgi:hypothetical protein
LVALALGSATLPAAAQVVRGTIRTQQTAVVVPGARITATDTLEAVLAEAVSDAAGRFTLELRVMVPFRVTVKKVGWQPSSTDLIRARPADTLEFDFLVPADPITLDTVQVKGAPTFNQRALDEAKRRGWKLILPEAVERHRETTIDFFDMLRAVQGQGIMIPYRSNDCVRSIRYRRCLTYVLDGQPSGTQLYVNPRDVYFIALLSATESAVQWGDKAPWGAIVIYTRMNGDRRKP